MMLHVSGQQDPADRIAIVGMGCILPGGIESPAALWQLLMNRGDAVREVPPDRWNVDAIHDPTPGVAGKTVTRRGGFLDAVAQFDAGFFGLSPREAAVMDPQQRLLLETAWRALEDAGIPVEQLAGSMTGVYIGISHSDYHGIQKFGRRQMDVHTATGGALSIAAARLSHRFDLRGRSLAIDTACSSSLVALDTACADLQRGECDMALVGGVNVILTPDVTISFSRAGMLSPDGRCKAFDASANGYVRGEGVGVVVLKSLARARADNDRIHAIIAATAVNQDGRTSTITVPSRDAQVQMLREACRKADIDPSQVAYVEAHGTGTAVGDPIEANAIGSVFGAGRAADNPCLIGSIKTNIGHLEPAAGIAGLIKAALCVNRGEIPASLHFTAPNPNIDFDGLGIAVARTSSHWPEGSRRTAVVNSFGFGGTNSCAVLMEAIETDSGRPAVEESGTPVVLAISGATDRGRDAMCGTIADVIRKGAALSDVAGTLALRRSHLDRRCAVLAHTAEEAVALLEAQAGGQIRRGVSVGHKSGPHRLGFVFTGQGAQWVGMGCALLRGCAAFRAAVMRCDDLFRPLSGWSIVDVLNTENADAFDRTEIAQPLTFAIQVAIFETLAGLGIHPKLVIGHSIGEIAAAYACGALTLENAVRVVFHRSRLQERARSLGAMAAVGLSPEAVQPLLATFGGAIEIAAINAPDLITVAGPSESLERFIEELSRDTNGVFCQRLRIDYAFHSSQMDPFKLELQDSLTGLQSVQPTLPMVSTVTGDLVGEGSLDARYWPCNMREPVLFKAAIDAAVDDGCTAFVEIGPHPALSPSIIACLERRGCNGLVVPSLRRDRPEQASLTSVFADLHVNGAHVDWAALVAPGWRFTNLPGASFERTECWAESEESRYARLGGPVHPLLGVRSVSAQPQWQAEIDTHTPAYLRDHRVNGAIVFPASAYVELMLAAAREVFGDANCEVEQIEFQDALSLNGEESVFVETAVDPKTGSVQVRSRTRDSAEWVTRGSGRIRNWPMPVPILPAWQPEAEPPLYVKNARFYRELKREGHDFGPAFQGVDIVWGEEGDVLSQVILPEEAGSPAQYVLHPALLDSCFQTIRGIQGFERSQEGSALALPVSIDSLRVFATASRTVFCRAHLVRRTDGDIVTDLTIIAESGTVVATVKGFKCRRIVRPARHSMTESIPLYRETYVGLPEIADAEKPHEIDLTGQTWLIVPDGNGVAEQLSILMERNGARATLWMPGHNVVAEAVAGVIYLPPVDRARAPVNAETIKNAWQTDSAALIDLIAAFDVSPHKPRLYVVTADGAAFENATRLAVQSAPLTGFLRGLANEIPELRPTLIDLAREDISAERIARELALVADETEVVVRKGQRFGVRLEPLSLAEIPKQRVRWNAQARAPEFRLSMVAPGVVENLRLIEVPQKKPGAGEVAIEVHAVGLNFRDVMAVTGLLPAAAEEGQAWQRLGFECAGLVRAVGEGGNPELVGQRVVAISPGSFTSEVRAPNSLVFPIPQSMSFADAAAMPVAYSTARYALVTLGRLSRGERVLIHAASGGVGLAAIAIAQSLGAEVFATAGNDEKREYLRERGVKSVYDSRSLSFLDDVLAATGGRGVDVVLNSLAGPFLEKSLKALAPGGRFLEIGKRDVYENAQVGLIALRQNVSLHVIDLARLAVDRPDILRSEIEAIIADLSSGQLPCLPVNPFPVASVVDAFTHMAHGRHIGKVVVTFDADADIARSTEQSFRAAGNATYLLTGGTSGLGLATARWLADRGARHIVVASRSGATPQAGEAFAVLRAAGVSVAVVPADVSVETDVVRLLNVVAATGHPLRGVVHAAGVIEDGLISQLTPERIARVFDGKVLGAWHLHSLTRSMPLDFFVMFSSVAEAIGSIGQSHYAAANRSLYSLAQLRRVEGLPALALAFGPVADCGHLAGRADLARYMANNGVRPMPVARVLEALDGLLQADVADICCADLDWSALAQSHRSIAKYPRTGALVVAPASDGASGARVSAEILSARPEQRLAMVSSYLKQQIAKILKTEAGRIDANRSLHEIGLDSLTSFELKNRIETDLAISLSIGKFVQRPSIASIAPAIVEQIGSAGIAAASRRSDNQRTVVQMSPGQEALWFIDHIQTGGAAYGLAMAIAVKPKLDVALADGAFRQAVSRHEVLRMTFDTDAYGPVPRLLDPERLRIAWHDAGDLDDNALQHRIAQIANRPFVLSRGPLTEAHVFRQADRDILLLHLHHIVADAASVAVVMEYLFESYFTQRSGGSQQGPAGSGNFDAFALWQRQIAEGPEGETHRAYWRKALAGAPSRLALKHDRPRFSPQGMGAATRFEIDSDLLSGLKDLAQAESTTIFAVLMAGFNVMLQRQTGDADIVIGTSTGGRTRPEFERLVGYLVNPVPIRTRFAADDTFRTLLNKVSDSIRSGLEHQDYPFPAIVRDLGVPRDADASPVFQVMLNMERPVALDSYGFSVTLLNTAGPRLQVRDLEISAVEVRRERAQFDLSVAVEEFDGKILGVVDYRADLWDRTSIDRMVEQYRSALRAFVSASDKEVMPPAAARKMSVAVGPTLSACPDVLEAIRAIADKDPGREAITARDGRWTYGELVARIDEIAAALAARGASPGSLVGIDLSRGRDLPAALLGVLRIGAAYVPLDRTHPANRSQQILADTKPVLIMTDAGADARWPTDVPLLEIDDLRSWGAANVVAIAKCDLAYVIHTSGSTGRPSGVEVSRGALANFLAAMRELRLLTADDTLLAITTTSFDIAALELMLPLTLGARIAVDDGAARDARRLMERLAAGDITAMQATPATWQMLVDAGWEGDRGLKALCGGEALPMDLARALRQRTGVLWNLYGPTETTVWSTAAEVSDSDARSIGRPIANTVCQVVDENLQPVPLGEIGELLIGGLSVARGYRNSPSRTAERFVPDAMSTEPGARAFRTGDLVRMQADGGLEFLGRNDRQMKLRGVRIEPAEIETALRLCPGVRESAVVLAGQGATDSHIVAFVTPEPGAKAIGPASIAKFLREHLPNAMMPASVRILESLPRLHNGKLDHARLVAETSAPAMRGGVHSDPHDGIEAHLLRILSDTLGTPAVTINDDFFLSGGTSLLGMRYVARAGNAYGIDLGAADLMNAPTVAALAKIVRERMSDPDFPLAPQMPRSRSLWKPLALVRAEGALDRCDASAITYLPHDLLNQLGAHRVASLRTSFSQRDNLSYWIGACRTPFGSVSLLTVPYFAQEMLSGSVAVANEVNAAIAHARRLGAESVSLTGIIPAITALGTDLAHTDGVTTGHATTACAMVRSIEAVVKAAGRKTSDEAIAFVGIGAIGTATLHLMLDKLPTPARLALCDVPAKQADMEALALEISSAYRCDVRCVVSSGARVPDDVYQCTLVVGATNVPNVIEVGRLRPGTLLVDDSFPHCFDVSLARDRIRDRGDLLVAAGGRVLVPGRIEWSLSTPPQIVGLPAGVISRDLLSVDGTMTGCILSSLLMRRGAPATLGPTSIADSRAHWDLLESLDIGAAPLHCGPIVYAADWLTAFAGRFEVNAHVL